MYFQLVERARLKISEESAGKVPGCRMEQWWKSNKSKEEEDVDDSDSDPNRNVDKVSCPCGLFAVSTEVLKTSNDYSLCNESKVTPASATAFDYSYKFC